MRSTFQLIETRAMKTSLDDKQKPLRRDLLVFLHSYWSGKLIRGSARLELVTRDPS